MPFRHNQIPNVLSMEAALYGLVGAQLTAMGHTVQSATGARVGGVQSIMLTADQNPSKASATGSMQRVNGYYRAGSDHRKDGQAVGW